MNAVQEQYEDVDASWKAYGDDPSKPSGAFEVYCNDQLIYSKLTTGKHPQPSEILRGMQQVLKEAK